MLKIRIKRRPPARPKTSKALYKLTAEPQFRVEGPAQGFLDGIVFTAESPRSLYKWLAPNNGTIISDFSTLVPMEKATEILYELHSGRSVTLPERYRLDQLKDHFGFNATAPSSKPR